MGPVWPAGLRPCGGCYTCPAPATSHVPLGLCVAGLTALPHMVCYVSGCVHARANPGASLLLWLHVLIEFPRVSNWLLPMAAGITA